eukprot:TRINITY_DN3673_c0_g1_i1.p1 TRINITY_DN3673_c0_g1~~TRINITY_DN3673_c0_g1_i1.p1  ORF type:complete len:355 (+),score=38.18 TRINITY_DN3673_c0_g1_i1:65-1129(+)
MGASDDVISFRGVIMGMNAETLELPAATGTRELVKDLRMQVAMVLRRPPGLVDLLINANRLQDSQSVEWTDSSEEHVQVIIKCCEAVPEKYEEYIQQDKTAFLVPSISCTLLAATRSRPCTVHLTETLEFPPPQGININMMPFIQGDKSSIPEEFQHYWPLIRLCRKNGCNGGADTFNPGKEIGYLTIHESLTAPGQSHRRPGIHTEAPGLMMLSPGLVEINPGWGGGQAWGQDGIYMASNVSDSLKVWPVKLRNEVIGHMGDCEHLRSLLGDGSTVQAGELIWLTDHTPHESLPLETEAYRQYFRVVVGTVSVWYSKHSTANRLGVEPNPDETKILDEDKFAMDDTTSSSLSR